MNDTYEDILDLLNECSCCERHKIDRPKKDKKWYDRGNPKKNLTSLKYLHMYRS
jgi:hypothetical protein